MVKSLAELHGGTVAAESSPGEGSCFTFWIPVRKAETVLMTLEPSDAVGSVPVQGMRTALVIEDDLASAELIRVQLEAYGFNVVHAVSAESAWALATTQPLALITLDILLPGADGWEILRRLKSLAALRDIPVLVISIVADAARGLTLGAVGVLQKPVSRQEWAGSLGGLGFRRTPPPPRTVAPAA